MGEEKIAIQENVSLKKYATFGIGGCAKYFFETKNKNDVIEAVNWAKQRSLSFFVLAGGSNLLVSDAGFSGLVLKMKNEKIKIKNNHKDLAKRDNLKSKNKKNAFDFVNIQAGVKLSDLGQFCLREGLSGLEWSSGIPKATVGGAVFMNAGAFGANMADIVERVEVFDATQNCFRKLDFDDCEFGYKESIFKKNKNLIIWSALLKLEKKAKTEIAKEIERVLEYRKTHHPFLPSAGSIFKNPYNISAGEVIEKCGLKGKQIGKAQIAGQHANFIVNVGGASFADVKSLIDLAKKTAQEKLNIQLEEEIQYLNFSRVIHN